MNEVDAHFQNTDCGLLFTTPTLITSDELLESYTSAAPEQATLRTSWHNLIDLCQNQNSMIYLRLVYPEITLAGDQKTKEHLRKFQPLYNNFAKFSGIEVDLTNGLLHSMCQNNSTLQKQVEYITTIIGHISESTNLRISLRLSCLQHIHLLSSRIPFNKNVSLIHLVDVKPSFLRHSSMLGLFSYFNGSDPPISTINVHHDLLLYRIDNFDRIKTHIDLAASSLLLKPDLEKRHTDPLPELRHRAHPPLVDIRRTGSPMTRRKTGFQDEIAAFAESNAVVKDDLSLRIAAWGWTILILVWVTFILGVGSVFGLFGAAQPRVTNYRQYEKDTGFPIPFYYPCLVILGCVVAWVWCIVSWMGMKFFRHAKAGIDD